MATPAEMQAVPGEDHTLNPDTLQFGQVVFKYGYIPCIAFGVEDDGTVELAEFGGIEFVQPTDISTARAPRPTGALPPQSEPGDRIAQLEAQVSALLELVKNGTVTAAPAAPEAPEAPVEPTDPSTPVVTPFGTAPASATPTSDTPAA